MKTLLIVGCGDVARRAIPWLARRFRVVAVVRQADQREALHALGVRVLRADLDAPASLKRLAGLADAVLHLAPPPDHGDRDTRTRHLCAVLGRRTSLAQRLVYISTTGVYGDCGGAWVDECRPVAPRTARAGRRVDAEAQLRGFVRRSGVAVTILRAPGIYAADRLPLARLERGDPVLRDEDDVYTNHIHAEDLARLACLALFRTRGGRVVNACDDGVLKMGAYFDGVADAFGLARPPRVSREEAARQLSPATLSFMSESRRIRNRRLHIELRARLRYPSVADGLAAARSASVPSASGET